MMFQLLLLPVNVPAFQLERKRNHAIRSMFDPRGTQAATDFSSGPASRRAATVGRPEHFRCQIVERDSVAFRCDRKPSRIKPVLATGAELLGSVQCSGARWIGLSNRCSIRWIAQRKGTRSHQPRSGRAKLSERAASARLRRSEV